MNIIKILSPAKINLALQVLSKRMDGYHNINTIFLKIPFYDELIFEDSDKTEIISNYDFNIPIEKNLVFQAIDLVKKKFKIEKNLKVQLNKRIPTGAGLGGGSSNAAMTLLFLNKTWNLNIDKFKLAELGLELGSDVPFFLTQLNVAIGKGRGEILTPLPLNLKCYLILVTSNLHVSTKEAYSGLILDEKVIESNFTELINLNKPLKKILFNDFESTVFQKHPELAEIKKILYDNFADYAGMSGSGSTMFGLFSNFDKVEDTITTIENLNKEFSYIYFKPHIFQLS